MACKLGRNRAHLEVDCYYDRHKKHEKLFVLESSTTGNVGLEVVRVDIGDTDNGTGTHELQEGQELVPPSFFAGGLLEMRRLGRLGDGHLNLRSFGGEPVGAAAPSMPIVSSWSWLVRTVIDNGRATFFLVRRHAADFIDICHVGGAFKLGTRMIGDQATFDDILANFGTVLW